MGLLCRHLENPHGFVAWCRSKGAALKFEGRGEEVCRESQHIMGIASSSYISSWLPSSAAPAVPVPLPSVEPSTTGPTCLDCGAHVTSVLDPSSENAFCGIGCYGRWYIRERLFEEQIETEDSEVYRENLETFLEKKEDAIL